MKNEMPTWIQMGKDSLMLVEVLSSIGIVTSGISFNFHNKKDDEPFENTLYLVLDEDDDLFSLKIYLCDSGVYNDLCKIYDVYTNMDEYDKALPSVKYYIRIREIK